MDIRPSFKMVDTCAAEFDAETPYYYSSFDGENEAEDTGSGKRKVLVLGSGPIRIGQGIEFDYCSVHSVWALRRLGCETIIVNNNPETVSTDFDVADKLYFEPLTAEDVEHIVELEKPWGAVVQFGGQTAIKLAKAITEMGVPILGTSSDGVDAAEDRERFDAILRRCKIPRAEGPTVYTAEQAIAAANAVGYPVLVRPSYVLGGQGMEIAYNDRNIMEFMRIINRTVQEHPILVDKYLMGREVEVDGIFDGEDILIPASWSTWSARASIRGTASRFIRPSMWRRSIKRSSWTIPRSWPGSWESLGSSISSSSSSTTRSLSSRSIPAPPRTIPYISKVTGIPIIDLATKVMLGAKLRDLGCGVDLAPEASYYAVKIPVFSFEKLTDVDTGLGPEMKSTGEVLGIAESFPQALLKAFKGANMKAPKRGGRIIVTVKDEDKPELIGIARGFEEMGVEIFATTGTARLCRRRGWTPSRWRVCPRRTPTSGPHRQRYVDLVINTPTKGKSTTPTALRSAAPPWNTRVGCVTAIDTARAIAYRAWNSAEARNSSPSTSRRFEQNDKRREDQGGSWMGHQTVIVLDFGGQYNQLIARRVRECGVYCEVKPYTTPLAELKAMEPIGVIFTGGPKSVYEPDSPQVDPELFTWGIPILGICYGCQLFAQHLGGKVTAASDAAAREYGKTLTSYDTACAIFKGLPAQGISWMSHGDYMAKVPEALS